MQSILFLLATSACAHTIFHEALINGKSQGQLFGVRAPSSNTPILDVSSSDITCNTGLRQPVSKDVIKVAPGEKFGTQWNHLISGPQGQGDADDPIAGSHKGPIQIYMAKVSDAASNDLSGLKFFKVAEQGLDTSTGKWAVDDLIANKGLWSFTMPSLMAGDYILRAELIGLHEANRQSGAQFYVSCANVRVTGSGTCNPSSTVSFPGAYSASDAGILVPGIYGSSGKPDNSGKDYTPPGPRPITCSGASGGNNGAGSGGVNITESVTTRVRAPSTSSSAASTTAAVNPTSFLTSRPSTLSTMTTSKSSYGNTTSNASATSEPWLTWSSQSEETAVAPIQTSTRPAPTTNSTKPGVPGTSSGQVKPSGPPNGPTPPQPSPPPSNSSPPRPTTPPGFPVSGTGPQPPTETSVEGTIGGQKYMCYEVSN